MQFHECAATCKKLEKAPMAGRAGREDLGVIAQQSKRSVIFGRDACFEHFNRL